MLAKSVKKEELGDIIKDLSSFYSEAESPEDKESLNSFLQTLLKNGGLRGGYTIPFYHLKKIQKEFKLEDRKKLFQVIEQILSQEKNIETEGKDSLHANIFKVTAYLGQLNKSDEKLFNKIHKLYKQKPCPNSNQLVRLIDSGESLNDFIDKFEILD